MQKSNRINGKVKDVGGEKKNENSEGHGAFYSSLKGIFLMTASLLLLLNGAAYPLRANEADFAGGEGTADDPYLVETAEQLDNVRNHMHGHFRQTADIDLSGFSGGEGWSPIGFLDEPEYDFFRGVYDGNEYSIENLTINNTEHDNVGLFGLTYGAGLKSINLKNANVKGEASFVSVGILVGTKMKGSVTDCHVEGKAKGFDVGGLAGIHSGGVIEDSSANVQVEGDENIGALVGVNGHYREAPGDHVPGEIKDSFAEGDVQGFTDSAKAGGLVGSNVEGGFISSCHANVQIASTFAAGGIAATNGDAGLIIDSFAAEGSRVEALFAGGVVGVNSNAGRVETCYSRADVVSLAGGAGGGIVGLNTEEGRVIECYSNNEVTGRHAGGVVGANVAIVRNSYALGYVVASQNGDSIIGGVVAINGLRNAEGVENDKDEDLAGEVTSSYSVAILNGGDLEGGIVGTQGADVISGLTIGTDPDDGPFFINVEGGLVDLGEVDKSYWNTDLQEVGVGFGDATGAYGKTTPEMTAKETFEGWHWDFANWTIEEEESYPYFAWAPSVPYADVEEFELTIEVEGKGTLTPESGTYTFRDGREVELQAVPEPGWMFIEWDGDVDDTDRAFTSTTVDVDKTVEALFEEAAVYNTDRYEGYKSINDALDSAEPGDTIDVYPVDHEGPVYLEEAHHAHLTLSSTEGPEKTTIDAGGSGVGIVIEQPNVTVEGFTVTNFSDVGISIESDHADVVDNVVDGSLGEGEIAGVVIGIVVDEVQYGFLKGNTIGYADWGIAVVGGSLNTIVNDNNIIDNDTGIIGLEEAGDFPSHTMALANNIEHNSAFGTDWRQAEGYNNDDLLAILNWWGDADGPEHDDNPEGTGDKVSDYVVFSPWIASDILGAFMLTGSGEKFDVTGGISAAVNAGPGHVINVSRSEDEAPDPDVPLLAPNASYVEIYEVERDNPEEIIAGIAYRSLVEEVVYWYDAQEQNWVECTEVEWNPEELPREFKEEGYEGYAEVTIDDKSIPSRDNFSGMVLATESEADDDDDSGDGSSSDWYDCFIATAAYGTPMVSEIDALRALRDQKLLTSETGRSAVDTYYRFSPPVAELIGRSDTARAIVREALRPVVSVSRSITEEE